jgi:MoxR-like ATPase
MIQTAEKANMEMTTDAIAAEKQTVEQILAGRAQIQTELAKVIVGQKGVIEELLIALFAGGHCLITGAPGLAKTLLVKSIAQIFHLEFRRVQFTPDLMPADITGTEILQESGAGRRMTFVPGPVFANMILADEINRTPPKTQAALLEAMQEHQVTAAGVRHALPEPFFVLATQNPIEQEGTYPLPEAQLDRFLFDIRIGYPNEEEEVGILRSTTGASEVSLTPVLDSEQTVALQRLLKAQCTGNWAAIIRAKGIPATATRSPEKLMSISRAGFATSFE